MSTSAHEPSVRIGVDVGGTFTDLVALDEHNQTVVYHKTPSTPADPSLAIATGIAELLAQGGFNPSDVRYLGHGTTMATNMVIERSGARTALITTRGFRDVLEIARQTRPNLYDYRHPRPAPLALRRYRFEVTERLSPQGEVLVPLDETELHAVLDRAREARLEAIAIALLHAYRNPVHEQRIAELARAALPDAFVCCSSEVLPEFREFERSSTTCMNAFLGPRMNAYMSRLSERASRLGITVAPHTVQSNGGLMSVDAVRRFPVRTCLSGPAAGVVAAAAIGRAANAPDLIGFDVGGTSTDVALIAGGQPATTAERQVAGYPVRSPMVDVHVIGAGGGSIAFIDEAGGLKVGPRSAGAVPGPVAYSRGGDRATLTDANVVLGRLNPQGLLGGQMPLDVAAAHQAIEGQIAAPLGLDVTAAALGIVAVAVANIARAIRSVSTERGHDPSALTLLACGGAGPLHAVAVAREVECRRVIVPVEPGTLCARGILLSDLRTDLVRTVLEVANLHSWNQVKAVHSELEVQADSWLLQEGLDRAQCVLTAVIEARYRGQSFEVPVSFNDLSAVNLQDFLKAFHGVHRGIYGYDIPARAVMLVNCRLQVVGRVPKAPLTPIRGPVKSDHHDGRSDDRSIDTARVSERAVCVESGTSPMLVPVLARSGLAPEAEVVGPAIVEEMSSTTYISPDDRLRVDRFGNLLISVGGEHAQ